MFFNSFRFLIFFPIVFIVYYLLPAGGRLRKYWLLAASYFFYMSWNAAYAVLILISTVVTYACGRLLDLSGKKAAPSDAASGETPASPSDASRRETPASPSDASRRKLVVAGSLIINLGILGYFKYFNFFTSGINGVISLFGSNARIPALDILLPVGISFYTFQAIGYTIDVYRGETEAESDFFKYALFVSFFPQLVAGPIERSKNLIRQLTLENRFDFVQARDGFLLMLWGYFLKVVLADRLAIFVDTVYDAPETYQGWFIVVATVMFGFQIYCDFYGYSTIAIGAAQILGIRLMDNFDAPYLADSVAGFWRRWHISLTSWFKDYLYIPLGGNRHGKVRKYINIMIVFLVSGLWHGASMAFVIWGGINGLYQVIGALVAPVRKKIAQVFGSDPEGAPGALIKALRVIITFILVDFACLFFRAGDMRKAALVLKNMFTASVTPAASDMTEMAQSAGGLRIFTDGSIFECGLTPANFVCLIVCLLILLISDICRERGIRIRSAICNLRWWFRLPAIVIIICAILVFGIWGSAYDAAGFIYFQF